MHGMMKTLAARLHAHALAEPRRRALADGERRCDYATLWSQAEAFAGFLHARGVRSGDRVAVLLPNSLEAIVAVYGCWLAAAVVVPLNVQARARDLAAWLAHSEARCVVFEAGHGEAITATAAQAPDLLKVGVGAVTEADGVIPWTQAVEAVSRALPVECEPEDLAMILYTSGTTGAPKGVMLSHANLAANADSIIASIGLSRDDSIVALLPFHYAYGASVLHTHLSCGAFLVVERNLVFPHLIVEAMARERVSGFSGVPSTFQLLLNRVPLAEYDLASLRYLTQAGGAMAPATIRRLREALPGVRLHIMYGQTEASARLTCLPAERIDDKIGSAGIPIAGVELVVRDAEGRLAPAFEVGEVHVRGPNVMRGYWRDAQASAAVLVDGWLKTGDMGHLDDEGFLFLSGRRNDMIKTGAHRVHPQDVEEVISELDAVAEVAVVGVDDDTLGQVVKAMIVLRAGMSLDAQRVKAHCRGGLAAYKIPKTIEFVAALPRTASGKIQRSRLTGNPIEPQEAT